MIRPAPAPELSPLSKHVKSLDGIRGLAVLGVMASHFFPATMNGKLAPLRTTMEYGAHGVDLFFVLSGFLITGILYDSLNDSGYFRKFYVRRALRIFPLYYGVVLAVFALTPWLGTPWGNPIWAYLFYLQNTSVFGSVHALKISHDITLSHFWSLAVEEQFYLAWPLLVFLIRRLRPLLWTCLILSIVAICLRFYLLYSLRIPVTTIHQNTLCRMDSLLTGAALALLMRSSWRTHVLRIAPMLFPLAVAAVWVLTSRHVEFARNPYQIELQAGSISLLYTMLAASSAALIGWSLDKASPAQRLFESSILRFFGKYSYGLYVLHFVALGFMLRVFKGWIHLVTPNKAVAVVGAGTLSFFISVAAAYVSYNLYEKRFLQLKRFVDYDRPRSSRELTTPEKVGVRTETA